MSELKTLKTFLVSSYGNGHVWCRLFCFSTRIPIGFVSNGTAIDRHIVLSPSTSPAAMEANYKAAECRLDHPPVAQLSDRLA